MWSCNASSSSNVSTHFVHLKFLVTSSPCDSNLCFFNFGILVNSWWQSKQVKTLHLGPFRFTMSIAFCDAAEIGLCNLVWMAWDLSESKTKLHLSHANFGHVIPCFSSLWMLNSSRVEKLKSHPWHFISLNGKRSLLLWVIVLEIALTYKNVILGIPVGRVSINMCYQRDSRIKLFGTNIAWFSTLIGSKLL